MEYLQRNLPMAAAVASFGPYLTFLIILIGIITYMYWEKYNPDGEAEEEEDIDNEYYNSDELSWIPYHESDQQEEELEPKYASISEYYSENEVDIDNNQKLTKKVNLLQPNLVQPVEHYASSRGSMFART